LRYTVRLGPHLATDLHAAMGAPHMIKDPAAKGMHKPPLEGGGRVQVMDTTEKRPNDGKRKLPADLKVRERSLSRGTQVYGPHRGEPTWPPNAKYSREASHGRCPLFLSLARCCDSESHEVMQRQTSSVEEVKRGSQANFEEAGLTDGELRRLDIPRMLRHHLVHECLSLIG
jgi:hypothetical protein